MKISLIVKIVLLFNFLVFSTMIIDAQTLGSLEFDGINNFIEIENSPLNTINTGDFTIEAWVRGDESEQETHPMILSNRVNTLGSGILFFFHAQWGDSQSKMLCLQIDGNNHFLINNGTWDGSLLNSKCHHVAVSRTENVLSFYADGHLLGTKNIQSSSSVSAEGPLRIGKDEPTNNTFNGSISQCRIWNVGRTETEIFENKDLSLTGNEQGLIAYWEMNEENGQEVIDKTANQFNGRLGSDLGVDNQDPTWSLDGCVESTLSTESLSVIPVKIYPNPTADFVTIEKQYSKAIQIQLVNQLGKLIFAQTMDQESIKIDLSSYPKGTYYINMIYKEGILTEKVVKY